MSIRVPIVEKRFTTISREIHDIFRERERMLQYGLKLTVKKYDEKTSEKIAEFDWDERLADEAKEKLEALLQSLVFVPDKGNEVYVFSISSLSRVD